MIEINDLVKKYGDHVAVDHLTLQVEPGRIYGFLGPNGAGKSTTMNMITGYLGATSGEIKINGHDILAEPEEAKKCIGYLPEIPPLYLEMSVEEYLLFAAEIKKLKKADHRAFVEDAMQTTGLLEVRGRLIRNLSKGYRQRVGLAQAILGYPDIIILDEPTVGLDPKQIIEIRELIRNLGQKHTVILSSHILTEIAEVCDYVYIISQGKLVAGDTTQNLISQMSGAQEIELTVKGDSDALSEVLGSVEGMDHYQMNSSEKDGLSYVTVYAQKACDIREELFFAFADARLPIMQMNVITKSLEEVFLSLTKEGEKKA